MSYRILLVNSLNPNPPTPTADGFFDGKTSAAARQQQLLEFITTDHAAENAKAATDCALCGEQVFKKACVV